MALRMIGPRALLAACIATLLFVSAATGARAEAKLLVDAESGKVLYAQNATSPWYPASVTKLMTAYTTLREVKAGHITMNTLLTVTPDAVAQQPTKMGFKVGTKVTVDNALKMMLVKSANDIAVTIAENVGGSIDKFAEMMNENARRLGMTQTAYVNPNGLPDERQVTSARDLAILTRAIIHDFPEYGDYFHISAIRYGKRVIHNYNKLLDRYPGADGMKTGFICAAGYNLVATATRNGRRLIAIILGAHSGRARTQEAAQLLENGFKEQRLAWLTPALGKVDGLAPIDAQPANLRDEVCGPHRHKPSEDNDEEEANTAASGDAAGSVHVSALSNLNAPKYVLGPPIETAPPVVVFTGPANHPDTVDQTIKPAKKAAKKAKHRKHRKSPAKKKAVKTKAKVSATQ
ncbi:MAG TPA: D-alanyl-D-alanine carboxypeptidase family protein [Pseudolabrys sp.]|jgi:D-alanyl-D-alanine carboxypeptidase|nr:D-alanyl-D-alanine carboxypeptidase family protein [Pseudolabrys sp.]